jgi:DNA-directed RNA polymerase specialized sigma24 family protein
LPLLQRQIVELVLVESNSYSDAAFILGLTTDEVVTHLALARYALMTARGSMAA